ncbi:ABC transporter permease, partial [Pseudomonas fluorescens]
WMGTLGAESFMPSNGGIGSLVIGTQQLLRMDLILIGILLVVLTVATLNPLVQPLLTDLTL